MTRWNKPMRRFVPTAMVCGVCNEPVKLTGLGGWVHAIDRVGIKDPSWHLPADLRSAA